MSTQPAGHPPTQGLLARFVPITPWLPGYQRGWLAGDAIAGFTIWGLLIPEMIAYASLAGLPPQAGLYTLLASLVLYAIFGTSRQLVVAGTSASAILVFSAVTALKPHNAAAYATLAAGMITLAGLIFVVAGLLRLPDGFVVPFYLSDRKLRISVARVGDHLYAFDDLCTCAGNSCPLSGGSLTGTTIMYQCHGSEFDVTTGAVVSGPARRPLTVYEVQVVEGSIRIRA